MPPAAPPPWSLLIAFATIAAIALASLSVLSRLVRVQRMRHKAAWESDGCPPAPWLVPWRSPPPDDPSLPRSAVHLWRTQVLVLPWLFVTPAWARADAEARSLLRLLRVLQLGGLAGFVIWTLLLQRLTGGR